MIDKMNLTETDLQKNYNEFVDFVKSSFSGERKKNLLKMYSEDEMGLELSTAPASMCEHFHLCHPGGYAQHIMNVIKMSFVSKKMFEMAGAKIDFTDEEMIFSAMHHDLGKLGDPEFGGYYVNQDESWKQKKGEFYKMNGNLPYMDVTERALFLLQKYGVKYNWKESLAIKLSDGMYNEANGKCLMQFNPALFLKTNLPRVIHTADFVACRGEADRWKYSSVEENV